MTKHGIMFRTCRRMACAALSFDKMVKRHLGIETPLYKIWWEQHSHGMQRRLDRSRATSSPAV